MHGTGNWVKYVLNSCFNFSTNSYVRTKIQQTKMLVTGQRFGDLFLFGLVWQYSSVQTKYNKGRFKVMALSLRSYTGSALKRELNFCNGYLRLLYFWIELSKINLILSLTKVSQLLPFELCCWLGTFFTKQIKHGIEVSRSLVSPFPPSRDPK